MTRRARHNDVMKWTTARFQGLFLALTILGLRHAAKALDIDDCGVALGMQTGEIPDSAITASSSYDPESVGPTNARIRTETRGGAWCPAAPVSKDVYEYLEIDLGELKVITMVETQGRFGHGQGQEYAERYLLEYQREDVGRWFRFHNRRGQEIIPGNTNTYIAEMRGIDPPIIARRLRFIPYSNHPKTVCMRVEVSGCSWLDGTVSYDMPQGERRGTDVDLFDFIYDGKIHNEYLSGGLGQLTDGQQGQSNFRLDQVGLRRRGYEWIGWRNESLGGRPVEIVFKFDALRNFTSMRIHSNNMFSKDVRVFGLARIYFSVGGQYFLGDPIEFKYMRDTLIEYSRPVIIPLDHGLGQYVKVELHFDAKWMMISEVQFESEYTSVNLSEELAPPLSPNQGSGGSSEDGPKVIEVIDVYPRKHPNYTSLTKPDRGPSKDENEASGPDGEGATISVLEGLTTGATERARKNLDDEYIGIIIGALAALILLLFAVIVVIIMRHRRNKYNNNHRAMKPVEPRNVTLDMRDIRMQAAMAAAAAGAASSANGTNGKLSNGQMYNCVATSEEDTNTSRDYAIPDLTKSALLVNIPGTNTDAAPPATTLGRPPYPGPPPAVPPPGAGGATYHTNPFSLQPSPPSPPLGGVQGPYGASELAISLPSIQGVSGNNVYAAPGNLDNAWAEETPVIEFPRETLKFVQKLGEGQFGEVHLCEAIGVPDMLGDDFLINRTADSRSMLVAVKMLRRNASEVAKADFQKEVKIMARLKDPNIVRVLGVCTEEEPLCVVVEYMRFGDLHQFIQLHQHEATVSKRKPILSYGCLIYMATQIASGMKYLENLNMVHRDLASRNCLVGHNYTIKISDFGMSRSLYSSDYYRIEGKAVLPIRWMAWESVLLGKFSTKSDVWSMGVTLWELLTFAREQPYSELSDDQVIENCSHFYRADSLEVYPPQPAHCPREIYDLMKECWNRDVAMRPSFREIHMFLMRKNMGFNPQEEALFSGNPGMTPGGATGGFGTLSKDNFTFV